MVLVLGNTEEHHREYAYTVEAFALLDELIDREAVLPRHGLDLLADATAVDDEEGSDEVSGLESGLTNERTEVGSHA